MFRSILEGTTDNRAYDYSTQPVTERAEYAVIVDWVPEGSRVLDLDAATARCSAHRGGASHPRRRYRDHQSGVAHSRAKGLDVRQGAIDVPLDFPDDSFDIAVCNVTVQMVMYPEVLLREMRRLGSAVNRLVREFRVHQEPTRFSAQRQNASANALRRQLVRHRAHPSVEPAGFSGFVRGTQIARGRRAFQTTPESGGGLAYRRFPNVFTSIPILKLVRI